MTEHIKRTIRPDAKGRINLGDMAKGVSGFRVEIDKDRRIILEPLVEIPAREQWLYKNKLAIKRIRRGVQDAADGKLMSRGDFTQYLDEEIE